MDGALTHMPWVDTFLSTHANRQGVDISVTVFSFVRVFVRLTDFSAKDKANGIKFCRAVHQHPGPF